MAKTILHSFFRHGVDWKFY